MHKVKLYGESYDLENESDSPVDMYYYKGELVDDEPEKGRYIGNITLDDGTLVGCYKARSKLPVILIILVTILGVAGGLLYYFLFYHPDVAIGGTMLEVDVDKNVITFNGIPALQGDTVDIRFVNGELPATVEIVGEGVTSEVLQLEPYEAVVDMPVSVSTQDNVVEATVRVTSGTAVSEFPIILEIPDNNNDYSTMDGVNGYFDKELIINED